MLDGIPKGRQSLPGSSKQGDDYCKHLPAYYIDDYCMFSRSYFIFSHDTVKFTALGIGFGRQKSATLRSKARSQVTQAAGRAERVNVPFRTTQQEGPNSEA